MAPDARHGDLGVTVMEPTAQACLELGRQLGFDEAHSLQDARLAVRLFDLTAGLHHLDARSRELLYYAGLLHDIGYAEGYTRHHKTAFRLIAAVNLPGLSGQERQVVANVARYHRGAWPTVEHSGFAALHPEERDVVRKLAGLLRLADGLDRSHSGAVRDLGASLSGDQVEVLVVCAGDCSSEVWAAEKKGRLFADVFGVRLAIRASTGALTTLG